MKYYRVTAPFLTVAGQLHLTDAQADARNGMLHPIDGQPGHYATRQPVGFKLGEVFGASADLRPGTAEVLDMAERDFTRTVLAERRAAADKKAAILKARADSQAKLAKLREQRERDQAEAAARAAAARKAKLAAAEKKLPPTPAPQLPLNGEQ